MKDEDRGVHGGAEDGVNVRMKRGRALLSSRTPCFLGAPD